MQSTLSTRFEAFYAQGCHRWVDKGSCARRRYMRATELRWPLRLLSRGRAVDLVNLELKAALVNGGYAVVTVDVRGTGAASAALLPLRRTIVARSIVRPHIRRMVWPENAVLTSGSAPLEHPRAARCLVWAVARAVEPQRAAGLCGGP